VSNAKRPRILVVDDEPQIRRLLRVALGAQDFDMVEAENAALALKAVTLDRPDLVILDLGLPDGSGYDVIEKVRVTSAVPILVLSVRSDEAGKVRAFDLGADDYVTKPFGMAELVARIRAALRHRLQEKGAQPVLRCGDVTIDLVDRRVKRLGEDVHLSKTEFEVLRLLAENAGRILTHQHILRTVWGPFSVEDVQYLRVYIRALRRKLEAKPEQPELIRTESGVGYRLVCPEPAPGIELEGTAP
jgi:two-component system KDP operon response regulator KdpE